MLLSHTRTTTLRFRQKFPYFLSFFGIMFSLISADRARFPNEIVPMKAELETDTFENTTSSSSAGKAIDTDLFSRAVIQKNLADISWIKISLDNVYFITKVVIYSNFFVNWYHQEDDCVKSVDKFRSCLTIDGLKVTVSEKICATLQAFPTRLNQEDQVYPLLCEVEGKDVILSQSEEDNYSLRDVAILGYSDGMFLLLDVFWSVSKSCKMFLDTYGLDPAVSHLDDI